MNNLEQLDHKTFKYLSYLRIKEAKVLFKYKQYCGAYYLLGYSMELALKACYCKGVKAGTFPIKEAVAKLYSHNLENLLDVSGLKLEHSNEQKKYPKFSANWLVVKDWSETSRYDKDIKKKDVESLMKAITDGKSGVFNWVKKLW